MKSRIGNPIRLFSFLLDYNMSKSTYGQEYEKKEDII